MIASCVLQSASAQTTLFSDVSDELGAAFQHVQDTSDGQGMGAGGAWADFDNDGDLDIFVGNNVGANALFVQENGSFIDRATEFGVDDVDNLTGGAVWGDYDNDGDQDLYILNRGPNRMFRNDGTDGAGGWVFTDVTESLNVAGFGRSTSAAYGDYDNDGWLDLYVGNHTYPQGPPTPGDDFRADYLFHNVEGPDGQRTFVDVAPDMFGQSVLDTKLAHSVGFVDFDRDGDLDIYTVIESMSEFDPVLTGENQMWRNDGSDGNGGWLFTDVAPSLGLDVKKAPMGLAIGDFNNDGWFDLAMPKFGSILLYQSDEGQDFSEVAETRGLERTFAPGTDDRTVGWGAVFVDYDLDGYEDIYMATGRIGAPNGQPNTLHRNNADPPDNTFTDVSDESGADNEFSARCVIRGDYDGDGDEDLFVVNRGGITALFRNNQTGGDFLALDLVGTRSNRDAIGARLELHKAGFPSQTRLVQSGSTTNGSHERTIYWGVTGYDTIDSIIIDWPTGSVTNMSNVAVNQRLLVGEPGLLITGQSGPFDNGPTTYQAILFSVDGTSTDVTADAVWSVEAAGLAVIEDTATLMPENVDGDQPGTVTASFGGFEATLPILIRDAAALQDGNMDDDPDGDPMDEPDDDNAGEDDPNDSPTDDGNDAGNDGEPDLGGPTLPGTGDNGDGTGGDDDNPTNDGGAQDDAGDDGATDDGAADGNEGDNPDDDAAGDDNGNGGNASSGGGGSGRAGGGSPCGAGMMGLLVGGALVGFLRFARRAVRRS